MWPFSKTKTRPITMGRTFVNPEMYKGHPVKVVRWEGPPAMEPGAPDPVMKAIGDDLYLAYLCQNPEFLGWDKSPSPDHPGFESFCALLKFEGLSEHYIGPPNDEALHLHPLYAAGLGPYG